MIRFKEILLVFSAACFGLSYAQTGNIPSHYASMYENQRKNTPAKEAENISLSVKDEIEISINRLQSDPVLRNANWGFALYDPKTKKLISSYNEESAFVPASTTKLLTTDTALSLLGPDFRWVTQLEYSGEIDENGVLNGNLYIVSSGDPSLGTGKAGASTYGTIVQDFLYAIKEKGIKKIGGNIVIQTALFKENKQEMLPENIVWLEHNNYYLPVGTTTNVDPRNERLTASKKNPFEETKQYYYVSPYIHKLVFADEFKGGAVEGKIPDAPSYLASALRTNLIKNGIGVSGVVSPKMQDRDPEARMVITAYRSPALKDIVYDTNQRSDNNLAESLLRTAGFQRFGDQSLSSGKSAVIEHLKERGFDTSHLVFADGSGLSRSHRVTPISQVTFLADQMQSPYYEIFFDSLPIAGQTGTLKKSFYGDGYGQIFAKTGTLNKVKTLAGYVKTRSGRILTFSLLINNYAGSVTQVKDKMEELLDPVVHL